MKSMTHGVGCASERDCRRTTPTTAKRTDFMMMQKMVAKCRMDGDRFQPSIWIERKNKKGAVPPFHANGTLLKTLYRAGKM